MPTFKECWSSIRALRVSQGQLPPRRVLCFTCAVPSGCEGAVGFWVVVLNLSPLHPPLWVIRDLKCLLGNTGTFCAFPGGKFR